MPDSIRPAAHADAGPVRALVFACLAEYGLAPDPAGTDADLADPATYYGGYGGAFDVVTDPEGRVVGTVGLLPLGGGRCELRKMYLQPEARGRGLGRRLLAHALARAAGLGFTRVELETASVLREAVRLYESVGFRPLEGCRRAARCDRSYSLDLPAGAP